MTRLRTPWVASIVLGLTLLAAGASCESLTINGERTKGTSGGGPAARCTAVCSTSDAVCGALGCDDAGACVYPSAGTSCPGTSCSGSMLSQKVCDGDGACEPQKTGTACPGNFACGIEGSCATSCNSSAYCASGFVCNAGTCVRPIDAGSCTENDDCTSALCGASGTGNCCPEACANTGATCGSTGCDDGGACLYAADTVFCGPGESCSQDMQTNASLCDGLGHCGGGGTTPCAPFACGIDACKTACIANTDCVTGDFCDALTASCCADLAPGSTLAVDSVLGDDATPCCGYGGAAPCRTLAHAMSLVEAGPTEDMVLQVTVDGGASGDWTAEGEIYPIELGWGAELSAPGIDFRGPDDAGPGLSPVDAIFELVADAGAAEVASIVGTPTNPVGIGMDQQGDQLIADSAIWVVPGATLYLANVSVNGSWWDDLDAILAGGTLVLGQDRSGAVSGMVRIGNDLANPDTGGYIGIECDGCTLRDVPMNGASSVVITGQRIYDIEAESFASVSLTSAPILGVAPASLGFRTCPAKPDYIGIYADGPVTMKLDHATIQCTSETGILVEGYDGGIASLTINDTTIQNTQVALEVSAGSAVVSNSTIRYNNGGVVQETNNLGYAGIVDLSGGTVGGRNTVACINTDESDGFPRSGIAALNETSVALNASNVDWDTPGPDLFSCYPDFSNCTCALPACTSFPFAPSMDGVFLTTSATILTTGNGLSPLNCAVPPGD